MSEKMFATDKEVIEILKQNLSAAIVCTGRFPVPGFPTTFNGVEIIDRAEVVGLRKENASLQQQLTTAQDDIIRLKGALEEIQNTKGEFAGVACRVIARETLNSNKVKKV